MNAIITRKTSMVFKNVLIEKLITFYFLVKLGISSSDLFLNTS